MNETDSLSRIVKLFQRHLWLPDPGVVLVVLATAAANRLPGDPLWLLVVGAPSSGKTETLDSLSELSEYHAISTFTEAGLLSGSPGEGSGATGGLLMEVGDQGLIVASDFGTLLNEHGSTRNRLFACLREVFDGKFIRRLGTQGGRTFAWVGHAGFIGACTEAIDSPSIDLGLLGERFTYYRMPATSADDEVTACLMADANAGHQRAIRAERARVVREFFDGLTIPDLLPLLTLDEQDRLITLATVGSRCRSSVVRDGYSREVELVPGHERSPRLYGQLRQLHAGLSVIGVPSGETWRLLAQAAFDGVHPGRRAVLDYLVVSPGVHATATVAGHCRLPVTPTRRHLEDLTAHGVFDRVGEHPERWKASEWLLGCWWAVADPAPGGTP
ncbi:MAG TPA: hypothetical protein VEH82_05070 [Acidimicrobiales bacterium]|nr:hypothetical protein [Acidimicrobiales bacterium]